MLTEHLDVFYDWYGIFPQKLTFVPRWSDQEIAIIKKQDTLCYWHETSTVFVLSIVPSYYMYWGVKKSCLFPFWNIMNTSERSSFFLSAMRLPLALLRELKICPPSFLRQNLDKKQLLPYSNNLLFLADFQSVKNSCKQSADFENVRNQ